MVKVRTCYLASEVDICKGPTQLQSTLEDPLGGVSLKWHDITLIVWSIACLRSRFGSPPTIHAIAEECFLGKSRQQKPS